MATIGNKDIVAELIYLGYKRRFASDGKVYQNVGGNGWKVYGKIRTDVDKTEFLKEIIAREGMRRTSGITKAATKFNRLFGSDALRAKTAYELLGDDLDGVWSELNDWRDNYTFDDIKEGAKAYNEYKRLVTAPSTINV